MHHIYLITRFATDRNQRNIQLLNLKLPDTRLYMVAQRGGSRLSGEQFCLIRQWPKPTSLLRFISPRLEKAIDAILFPHGSSVLYRRPALRFLRGRIRSHFATGDAVSIVSCLPPHELVLIGLNLKRTFPKLRWIIDWQDLWSADEYYADKRSKAYAWIRETEHTAAHRADFNVVTNERAAATFQKLTGVAVSNIESVPPAFGSADFRSQTSSEPTANLPLRLGFLGSLLKPPKVPGAALLTAIDKAIAAGLALRFTILGDKEITRNASDYQKRFPWLEVVAALPHGQAVEKLKHFDILVLLLGELPNCHDILHAKLPYYLAAEKPILAVVPHESICADVVTKCGVGSILALSDLNNCLVRTLNRLRLSEIFRPNPSEIANYSWINVAPKWAGILTGRRA